MKPDLLDNNCAASHPLLCELLIMADGRIFVQNLTQPMAEVLLRLNPEDQTIKHRVLRKPSLKP